MKNLLPTLAALIAALATATAFADSDHCLSQAQQAIDNQQLQQAETLLQNHLQHHGDDTEALFTLARVWAWQKNHTQSLRAFNQLLEANPDNSDVLLARARLHEWMGNDDLALTDLQHARELSPDYLDVWKQQIRLLSRRALTEGDDDVFSALLQQAQQRFPQQNWRQWLRARDKPQNISHYFLATRAGRNNLSNNRAAWNQASVMLSGRTSHGNAHIQIDSFDRFNLNDWQLAGGASIPVAPEWRVTFNGSISPTARVIARNRVEAIISKRFSNGFNLHTGAQHANFAATSSQQLHVTAEYYWSRYRFAYTYRLIDVDNAGVGHNQRTVVSASYGAANSVSLALANGKDVEYDGTTTPPVSTVSTLSLYGRHAISQNISLTWSTIHHQQGNFYTRNGFVLGAQFDF